MDFVDMGDFRYVFRTDSNVAEFLKRDLVSVALSTHLNGDRVVKPEGYEEYEINVTNIPDASGNAYFVELIADGRSHVSEVEFYRKSA